LVCFLWFVVRHFYSLDLFIYLTIGKNYVYLDKPRGTPTFVGLYLCGGALFWRRRCSEINRYLEESDQV
jgi:hypothetical protein